MKASLAIQSFRMLEQEKRSLGLRRNHANAAGMAGASLLSNDDEREELPGVWLCPRSSGASQTRSRRQIAQGGDKAATRADSLLQRSDP